MLTLLKLLLCYFLNGYTMDKQTFWWTFLLWIELWINIICVWSDPLSSIFSHIYLYFFLIFFVHVILLLSFIHIFLLIYFFNTHFFHPDSSLFYTFIPFIHYIFYIFFIILIKYGSTIWDFVFNLLSLVYDKRMLN